MRKSSKYIIAIICLVIIVFRILYPELNFDLISLGLLAIGTLALLIKNPQKIFDRTKRIKIAGNEWEFQELNKETEEVEKNTVVKSEELPGLSGAGYVREKFSYQITSDLPTETIKISVEIEKTLRTIYELHFNSEENRPLAVTQLMDKLKSEEIINRNTHHLLRTFWKMRNKVVHDHKAIISDRDYLSFIDIGIRILTILKTIQFNNLDGKLPHIGLG